MAKNNNKSLTENLLCQENHDLTPKKIVAELDKHIIGQHEAKTAVAVALRNRWRRKQLTPELRAEVTPKNILMIGPTGVGKTEIARRLAKLVNAPFIKVEATKFTEVGFVGRDVESIIRDLVDIAVKFNREQAIKANEAAAQKSAEDRILDVLLRPAVKNNPEAVLEQDAPEDNKTRELFRKKLQLGELDDKEIEINVATPSVGVDIIGPPGMEDMTSQLQSLFQNLGSDKKKSRKMPIKDAMKLVREEEASSMIDDEEIKSLAVDNVEQNGIVFIDEIDKIAKRGEGTGGADISREGVQRDLLPLVEGSTISTKYGMVKTDHILFIASGAFHVAKPSDLIPELQGRFPIRVELKALSVDDFQRILVEPDASLTIQYAALMATEAVTLTFKKDGIADIAQFAWKVNESTENIGARRLHTVMERLLEEVSFTAPENAGAKIVINSKYVKDRLADLVEDQDLSHYIL